MEWREVVGYPGYEISNIGAVRSFKSGEPKMLSSFKNYRGYVRVGLMLSGVQKQVFVHRLVAESFIGEIDDGYSVNHIDGNKGNNCVENLEIITHKENVNHSLYVLGKRVKPVFQLDKHTLKPIKRFKSAELAGRELEVDGSAIWKVCNQERNFAGGYSWCYVDEYSEQTVTDKQNKINKGLRRKKVYQIHPETNHVVKSFVGVRVAERDLGLTTIKHVVSGRLETAGGYKWSYEKPIVKIGDKGELIK